MHAGPWTGRRRSFFLPSISFHIICSLSSVAERILAARKVYREVRSAQEAVARWQPIELYIYNICVCVLCVCVCVCVCVCFRLQRTLMDELRGQEEPQEIAGQGRASHRIA